MELKKQKESRASLKASAVDILILIQSFNSFNWLHILFSLAEKADYPFVMSKSMQVLQALGWFLTITDCKLWKKFENTQLCIFEHYLRVQQ